MTVLVVTGALTSFNAVAKDAARHSGQTSHRAYRMPVRTA
jgi:hypothetical protein